VGVGRNMNGVFLVRLRRLFNSRCEQVLKVSTVVHFHSAKMWSRAQRSTSDSKMVVAGITSDKLYAVPLHSDPSSISDLPEGRIDYSMRRCHY
jgi:hypothetical protein